jgi:hypothetical protein
MIASAKREVTIRVRWSVVHQRNFWLWCLVAGARRGHAVAQRFLQRGNDALVPGRAMHLERHRGVAQAADDARIGRCRGHAFRRHRPRRHRVDQQRQALDQLFGVEAACLEGQAGLIADGRHGNRWGFRV